MLVIFPSGTFICFSKACGYNFWGVHGHDAIWHLAIAAVSFKQFPFVSPTYAGESLYGYNYLIDLPIFLLSKIGIDPLISYFKLFPVVWFIAFTVFLIILARKINDKPLFTLLFLFFNYFAGSFSFLLTLFHYGTIKGSSTLLPLPAMHMMSNLPYAFSLLFVIGLLIIMQRRKLTLSTAILAGVFIFLIFGFKFYGGVISLFLFGMYLLLLIERKTLKKIILYFMITGGFVIGAIFVFYNPFVSLKTGSVFGIAPFALIHPITEQPNQFYLREMTDARYFLLTKGIGPRLIAIESLNLIIFLFFYLGTRFFGIFKILYLGFKRKFVRFDVVVSLTVLFATLLTVLLVQKAEWWNTIQFFFYAIFLMTVYLTRLVYDMMSQKKIYSIVLAVIIIITSVPAAIDLVSLFWAVPGATYLSKGELKALNFLKKQPDGVVFTPLYNKQLKIIDSPNTLATYEDTAYVSAFSGKQVYLADVLQLRLTGVPYEKRLEKVKNLDCSIIKDIDYLYEIRHIPNEGKLISCDPSKFKQIYDSKEVFIYSITK